MRGKIDWIPSSGLGLALRLNGFPSILSALVIALAGDAGTAAVACAVMTRR